MTPANSQVDGLDALADSLANTILERTASCPVGLVGHSLGAAIAARAVGRLAGRVVGLLSIEGNLTEEDTYFSGEASRFDDPKEFCDHLLYRVRAMIEQETPGRREALRRYHASIALAAPETLCKVGRNAKAASAGDALGQEHRALTTPSLYY